MFKRYAKIRYIKNKAIRALLIGDGLVMVATAMFTPLYAIFVNHVGGDIFEVGITAAALAFGSGFASIISGKHIDKMKNKRILLVLGYALTGVAFVLYVFVTNVWQLAALQVVVGFAHPIYGPAYDALYSIHADKLHIAEEWGAWEALSYFTAGIGALFGSFLVSSYSFTPLFIFMAILCLMSSVYVYRLPKKVL